MRDHLKPCDWVRTELVTVESIRCALLELSMDSFDCNRKSTDLTMITMIRLSISLPSKWHLEKELSRFNCSNLFLFLVGIVLQRPASLWYDVTICCFLYDLPLPSIGGNKLLIFFSFSCSPELAWDRKCKCNLFVCMFRLDYLPEFVRIILERTRSNSFRSNGFPTGTQESTRTQFGDEEYQNWNSLPSSTVA